MAKAGVRGRPTKPTSVHSSIAIVKVPGRSNQNLPTKSWLQLNASATKPSRRYVAHSRFT
jgi:hypothetical protein